MMSVSSTDRGLLTPGNAALVFIDHQMAMLLHVRGTERAGVLQNAVIMAEAARIFDIPAVVTAIRAPGFDARIVDQVATALPGRACVARTSLNAWDCEAVAAAVRATGRRNLVLAALWSDVCLVMPALQALTDGYGVYAVEDASAGTSRPAHAAGLRRVEQAGGVSLSALQLLLEFQRDCARTEHYDEVMTIVAKARCDESAPRDARKRSVGAMPKTPSQGRPTRDGDDPDRVDAVASATEPPTRKESIR